jgi:hypothetical protein
MAMPEDERSQVSPTRLPTRWQWLALLAFALLVRSGFLLVAFHHLSADPDGYHRLAENLVNRGTLGDEVPIVRQNAEGDWRVTREFLPTAFRPPLYPCLLAIPVQSRLNFSLAVALLHLALGLLTVWLTVKIGMQLGLGQAAFLAGVLVACDPILLQQSSFVMTETLATLLTAIVVGCLMRCSKTSLARRSMADWLPCAVAGGTLALAALCRPSFLLVLPLAGCWLWFQLPKAFSRRAAALAYVGSALLVLAPWVVRNTLVFGKPIVATTHGGYTFHLANNPGFYRYLKSGDWGTVWKSTDNFRLDAQSNLTLNMTDYAELRLPSLAANSDSQGTALFASEQQQELLLDRLHYVDAWAAIRDEPAMFAYSILVRLGRFWQPLPHRVTLARDLPNNASGTAEAAGETSPESLRSWLARYLVALWYGGVYVLAALGLWYLRGKLLTSPWCWGLLLVVSFMALHALYWTDMRMRAPLAPVVCWWAAAGWNCYHSLRRERKA